MSEERSIETANIMWLDPDKYSIDEVAAQFHLYKQNSQQAPVVKKLLNQFSLDTDLAKLRADLLLKPSQNQLNVNEILSLPSVSFNNVSNEASQPEDEKVVVLTCGFTPCLFEKCNQRVDSRLMLLHYLTDHSEIIKDVYCHDIYEGQRLTLSFHPKSCHFRRNKVLGLLVYGGPLEQKFDKPKQRAVFNRFLPNKFAHLKTHVPIVALVCKTAASSIIRDKHLARKVQSCAKLTDQLYVIWLVTPNKTKHLNATMCLCGRDAAIKASSIVSVRHTSESQNTCKFMPVDANYWRLTYEAMRNISNNFRDDVHLEISITEFITET